MNSAEVASIKQTLLSYEKALNESDTKAVMGLYTSDGVFMPSGAPTAAGSEQVRASYDHVFRTIRLNIKFEINQVEVFGDVAIAQTVSRGEVTVLANKERQPEENREIFVLRKSGRDWKIARYIFNKMS